MFGRKKLVDPWVDEVIGKIIGIQEKAIKAILADQDRITVLERKVRELEDHLGRNGP